MKYIFLSFIGVSLMPLLLQPAHAIGFDCKRTNETAKGPNYGSETPHDMKLNIDLPNKVVTEIDGCVTTTYGNSSDVDATGSHYSKCLESNASDPESEKIKRDPVLSRLSSELQLHPRHNEVFHVTVTSDSTEWGLESREESLSFTLDMRTNVLSFGRSCHTCIAAWGWTATYQCRKVSR